MGWCVFNQLQSVPSSRSVVVAVVVVAVIVVVVVVVRGHNLHQSLTHCKHWKLKKMVFDVDDLIICCDFLGKLDEYIHKKNFTALPINPPLSDLHGI